MKAGNEMVLRNVQLILAIASKSNKVTTYVIYFLIGYNPLRLEK